ncbi:MAG: hypothetical protein M1823_002951 [Watsoniomyces obsoletus]|nr:MAG: hypothetical protein M1823_002951 [Watsoniomyces obsoletus]
MGTLTPLEAVILSQSLATHGTDPAALNRISASLREHPLLREQENFDPNKLGPMALQAASRALLGEQTEPPRANGTSEMNGISNVDGATDVESRKRKLSESAQQLEHSDHRPSKTPRLGEASERIYLEYKERMVREIRQDEDNIRRLQQEIGEIEEGRWDQRLLAEAAASEAEAKKLSAQLPTITTDNGAIAHTSQRVEATSAITPVDLSPPAKLEVARAPQLVSTPTQQVMQPAVAESPPAQESVSAQPEAIAQPAPLPIADQVTSTTMAIAMPATEPADTEESRNSLITDAHHRIATPPPIKGTRAAQQKVEVPSPRTPTEPPYSPLSEVGSLPSPNLAKERTDSMSSEKSVQKQQQQQRSPIRASVQPPSQQKPDQIEAKTEVLTRPVSEIQDSGGVHSRTRSHSRLSLETTMSINAEAKVKEEEPPTPATVTGPSDQRDVGVTTRGQARRSLDTEVSIPSSTTTTARGKRYRPKRDSTEPEPEPEPSATPDIPGPSARAHLAASSTAHPKMVMTTRNFPRTTGHLLHDISNHRFASMFARPVKEKDAPGYQSTIYRPQDLKSIKSAIVHGSKAVAAILGSSSGGGGSANMNTNSAAAPPPSTSTAISETPSARGTPTPAPAAVPAAAVASGSAAPTPASSSSRFPATTINSNTTNTTPSNTNNNNKNNIIWLQATPDIVPPKGIVNSAQLEKELMRMFANAVMFNPDPKGGFGDMFSSRKSSRSRVQRGGGAGTIGMGPKTGDGKRKYINGPWFAEQDIDIEADDEEDIDDVEEGIAPGPYLEYDDEKGDDYYNADDEGEDGDAEDDKEEGGGGGGGGGTGAAGGYEYVEGGVVRDTRDMFETVEKMIGNWRKAERATVVVPVVPSSSNENENENENSFFGGNGNGNSNGIGNGNGNMVVEESSVQTRGSVVPTETEGDGDGEESEVEYVSADDGDQLIDEKGDEEDDDGERATKRRRRE